MDYLNLSDITFKYKDDEGAIWETNMNAITLQLGCDCGIPRDVWRLTEYKGMLEIKIRDKVVWQATE